MHGPALREPQYDDVGHWKADVLSRYAAEHDVKHENIIMVDDLPIVGDAVQREGMQAVDAGNIKTCYWDADAQAEVAKLVVKNIHSALRQTAARVVKEYRLKKALEASSIDPDVAQEIASGFPQLGSTPAFNTLSKRDQRAALSAKASIGSPAV